MILHVFFSGKQLANYYETLPDMPVEIWKMIFEHIGDLEEILSYSLYPKLNPEGVRTTLGLRGINSTVYEASLLAFGRILAGSVYSVTPGGLSRLVEITGCARVANYIDSITFNVDCLWPWMNYDKAVK